MKQQAFRFRFAIMFYLWFVIVSNYMLQLLESITGTYANIHH